MIVKNFSKMRQTIASGLVLDYTYRPPAYNKLSIQQLSKVAQRVFWRLYPHERGRYISPTRPEVIALRILDYLSSKQGYIRRRGPSFRTEAFYLDSLPQFVKPISEGKPIPLVALCFCTTLANVKYAGESPYPHMGAYIALENMHKIAFYSREIYAPGLSMTLGYEGSLFAPLYFQSEAVIRNNFAILRELNELAYRQVTGGRAASQVQVVDALWMVEQAFGADFTTKVMSYKDSVKSEDFVEWKDWYDKIVSQQYFPSAKERRAFVEERLKWRGAVLHFKYHEGRFGNGFLGFCEDAIPFTPAARHTNMLALQMIPENAHLPHQRVMTHDPIKHKWRTAAFEDIQKAETHYMPCFVERFSYPFYFEKCA